MKQSAKSHVLDDRDGKSAEELVADAAWGPNPGRWPLPSVADADARWHRAVALGGQGRYDLAMAELDALDRVEGPSAELTSFASSTRASWIRQMGAHAAAARYDGSAVACVAGRSGLDARRARLDALTGLAADALGGWRFDTSRALLSRCADDLRRVPDDDGRFWRQRLRLGWVRAELAMMSGDGTRAVAYALDARDRAADTDSLRHRIKTDLVLAAAYSSVGDTRRAGEGARAVLHACSQHGLVPLEWAAGMLLEGLGDVSTASPIVTRCTAVLRRRGRIAAGA